LAKVRPEMLLAVVPHGTPMEVAKIIKTFVEAGLRVPKILDYGTMAGLGYAEASAANVRAAEDALLQLCGQLP
jgi:phthiodiolone/phenolphthiodiolone dimycocerosates ketoreductase